MEWYLICKAVHVIGFVSWFAGIFYLVRLFVYHREAWEEDTDSALVLRRQYEKMESRLYHIIQSPAMVLTLLGGAGMLYLNDLWLQHSWMLLKLALVAVLIIYHLLCGQRLKKLKNTPGNIGSFGYRLYNEVPTLLLIAIVMLAVWKSTAGLWMGLLILLLLGFLFFIAARLYRGSRASSK